MNQTELSGLARAKTICDNPTQRAEELRRRGKKIVGYLCSIVPKEIITAAGLVPYRIIGNPREAVTQTDAYIEPYLCPYVRNCFDIALKGRRAFIDVLVMPHACDGVQRIFGIWSYYLNPPEALFLNVPHTIGSNGKEFFKNEIGYFKEKIEEIAGKKIWRQDLSNAIYVHNENRSMVRDLYMMRKLAQPLISGTEMMRVLVAGSLIPANEFKVLLEEVMEEIQKRNEPGPCSGRLMVYGSIMDDVSLFNLIEESGACVVVDDTCIGTRSFWHEVDTVGNAMEALTKVYFSEFLCPRTYRGTSRDRFKYLGNFAEKFDVTGVIIYTLKYCDPHALDAPDVRDFFEKRDIPVLHIEDDYTMSNIGAVKTRVQAFLETIG